MSSEHPLVHHDADCLVVDKPSGLLSVQGRGVEGADCMSARLQTVFPEARVVHRLDMSTSGLLLFARSATAQRVLSRAFAERQVAKRYVAVVYGCLERDGGEIDLPLAADWPNRPLQKVERACGKPALTRYRVIRIDSERHCSRLELEPVTGRTHQLRVHLAAIGHPILGDRLYAPPEARDRATRLLLHAASLRFAQPSSGASLQLESAAPF